jgi:hypothetical protein
MLENIGKRINKDYVYLLTAAILMLFPVIELDYLFADVLAIRISTIVKFIVLPALILIVFLLYEKNKKKVFIFTLIYGAILGLYYLAHCKNAAKIFETIFFPWNFYFSDYQELVYLLTLVIPLFYIYVAYAIDIKEKTIAMITMVTSVLISFPILIGDLFCFGYSTYYQYTRGNIFTWFKNDFNNYTRLPKYYSSKFFFEEGNTIGIVLFIILPLLYYFFYKEEKKKPKIMLGVLIFVQTISMFILGTRISSYGAILVPAVLFAGYIALMLIKKYQFDKIFLCFTSVLAIISMLILPYSPAYQTQNIGKDDISFIGSEVDLQHANHEMLLREISEKDLKPGTPEYLNFYIYYFENNAFLIGLTPPIYYTSWYDYRQDPKFWVDFIFEYEFYERVNARQLERIFMDYKWDQTDTLTKVLGMGYSTFMNGSILWEKDFGQQFYTFGYLGFALIMVPYLAALGYCILKVVLDKRRWTFKNYCFLLGIGFGYVAGYVSGHTFDQFNTSLLLAILIGYMIKEFRSEQYEK